MLILFFQHTDIFRYVKNIAQLIICIMSNNIKLLSFLKCFYGKLSEPITNGTETKSYRQHRNDNPTFNRHSSSGRSAMSFQLWQECDVIPSEFA
jgi:hypothetical protein